MFLSIAALTYFFIYATLYKNPNIDLYGSTLLLTFCTFSFICNGIRQALAISIFLFASRFVLSRKWYIYFPLIVFASLFHTSILLCLPIYFLRESHLKKKTYIILYFASFIFIKMSLQSLVGPFMFLIEGNDRYMGLIDGGMFDSSYFSIGILLNLLNNILLLLIALKTDMEKRRPLWFNLFFFSIILMNMRIASPLFVRVQEIFSWFGYLLIPIMVTSIKLKNNQRLFVAYLITYLMVTTVAYINNPTSELYPYRFVSLF